MTASPMGEWMWLRLRVLPLGLGIALVGQIVSHWSSFTSMCTILPIVIAVSYVPSRPWGSSMLVPIGGLLVSAAGLALAVTLHWRTLELVGGATGVVCGLAIVSVELAGLTPRRDVGGR
jgi:hypothetical protein